MRHGVCSVYRLRDEQEVRTSALARLLPDRESVDLVRFHEHKELFEAFDKGLTASSANVAVGVHDLKHLLNLARPAVRVLGQKVAFDLDTLAYHVLHGLARGFGEVVEVALVFDSVLIDDVHRCCFPLSIRVGVVVCIWKRPDA